MTILKLYDTLSREKRAFVPADPDHVRVYVCGPTVYDFAHIGNARPIIVFDVLFRLLRHIYGADAVTYVRNITDVDDKINARAAEEGVPIAEITERTTAQFHADIAELGVLEPTVEPRATAHVAEMIEMISRLVDKGNAYAADGHVLFNVPSMADYGALSHRSLDEMEAGARVEVAPYKKAPTDFVLWKPSDADQPGWDSPWGRGRPGWHIECSAMSWKYLGETFDIHGGGVDLVFPHHENELAQSRCCWGTEVMANYWMHNGFLQVEGEKMSKSLGNFVTIHDLLQTDGFGGRNWPGEVLRLAMLMTHYRQPIDWTEAGLKEAETILDGWYRQALEQAAEEGEGEGEGERDATPPAAVLDALSDDLNTPAAIAELHKLRNKAARGDRKAARDLKAGAGLLGLLAETHHQWQARKEAESPLEPAEIEAMIAKRIAARKAKDWAEADRIRDELVAKGIVLMDGPEGTRWEVAR